MSSHEHCWHATTPGKPERKVWDEICCHCGMVRAANTRAKVKHGPHLPEHEHRGTVKKNGSR
jgi:hypothetical protein